MSQNCHLPGLVCRHFHDWVVELQRILFDYKIETKKFMKAKAYQILSQGCMCGRSNPWRGVELIGQQHFCQVISTLAEILLTNKGCSFPTQPGYDPSFSMVQLSNFLVEKE